MATEGERPIAALLHDIVGNVAQMVRGEIRLAKADALDEIGKTGEASKLVAVGALVSTLALGLLLLGGIHLLATVIPFWLAAMIVALGSGIIGAALLATGFSRLGGADAGPAAKAGSNKESVAWVKPQTR